MSRSASSTPTRTPEWLADILRDAPPILYIEEAAALTRLSVRTLRRMVAAGRLTSLRDGAGKSPARLLFPRAEIARLLTSMAQ